MLISSFFPCGQTTHVVSLYESLHRLGQEAELVVTHPANYPKTMAKYIDYLASVGANADIIPHTQMDDIIRYVKNNNIDVVHAHSSWDFGIAHAIHKNCGIPYVLTGHGLGLNNATLKPYLEAASRIICVGPRVAGSLDDYSGKLIVLQNGVDLTRFSPGVKEKTFTVVYAGRSDKSKAPGLKALLDATNSLRKPVQLYLAGTPNIASYASGRGKYVEWEPRIEKYMNRSHVVVGTGRAIREGMAAGNACLVLGWSYDGLVTPESLRSSDFPDFSGRCKHPVKPSADAIVKDLLRLSAHKELLDKLQQFGRRYAEAHFDLSQSTQQIIGVYKEAIASLEVTRS